MVLNMSCYSILRPPAKLRDERQTQVEAYGGQEDVP